VFERTPELFAVMLRGPYRCGIGWVRASRLADVERAAKTEHGDCFVRLMAIGESWGLGEWKSARQTGKFVVSGVDDRGTELERVAY
jgi:hypothetical protein